MQSRIIVPKISRILIPFIVLYGLYIQFHGDYSPGGGFQAGVIVASGLVLYGMVYGIGEIQKVISYDFVTKLSGLGVMLYLLTGIAPMLLGGEFLNYSYLASNQISGQHLGIFLIELGVGITVFSIILSIYINFTRFRIKSWK